MVKRRLDGKRGTAHVVLVLRLVQTEERKRGAEVKLGHLKVFVDGSWYRWNDVEG